MSIDLGSMVDFCTEVIMLFDVGRDFKVESRSAGSLRIFVIGWIKSCLKKLGYTVLHIQRKKKKSHVVGPLFPPSQGW